MPKPPDAASTVPSPTPYRKVPGADAARRAGEDVREVVSGVVARARAAQSRADRWTQADADEAAIAAGWAIIEPARNRALAELAVRDTGLGNVADKIAKNHRKTIGLLRDLQGARSVGVIAEDPERGIVEIARPVGVVAAITPSTNPAATPANNIINALKGRNAIVVAPSPKGQSTLDAAARVHPRGARPHRRAARSRAAAAGAGHPRADVRADAPGDLVVATGSQANVRAAYASGTPAFGVGAGNVAVIVDETADVDDAAAKIARSKTFDNATSCSSENSVIVVDAIADALLAALGARGRRAARRGAEGARCSARCSPDGKLSPAFVAQSARDDRANAPASTRAAPCATRGS